MITRRLHYKEFTVCNAILLESLYGIGNKKAQDEFLGKLRASILANGGLLNHLVLIERKGTNKQGKNKKPCLAEGFRRYAAMRGMSEEFHTMDCVIFQEDFMIPEESRPKRRREEMQVSNEKLIRVYREMQPHQHQ